MASLRGSYSVLALSATLALCSGCRCSETDHGAPPMPSVVSSVEPPPSDTIGRCQGAIRRINGLAPDRMGEAFATYAEGCAGMYREPGCQQAWRQVPTLAQEEQVRSVAIACTRAYCAQSSEPAAAACVVDAGMDAVMQHWSETHAAIVARDLGVSRDSPLAVGMTRLAAPSRSVSIVPVAAAAEPAIELRVVLTSSAVEISLGSRGASERFSMGRTGTEPPPPALFAALAKIVDGGHPTATVVCAPDVPHGAVVQILDGLKANGFSRVGLSLLTTGPK